MQRLYAIADLHLSFGAKKPMDIFRGWENYTDRIKANWKRTVDENDVVVIAGDISWSMDLASAAPDFRFLHELPGRKVIIKGNHDYWWSTVSKINLFFEENGFDDFFILHNNFFPLGKYAVCGSRGWEYDAPQKDEKIVLRECGRIEASLKGARENGLEPVVFLHYPPAYGEFKSAEIFDVLKKYNVGKIYHGHIHGNGLNNCVLSAENINMDIISCDCIDFTPKFICNY